MENGWVKIDRSILNADWFSDGDFVRFWIYVNCNVTHVEKTIEVYGESITLQPGQMIFGRNRLSEILKISPSKIERIISKLKQQGRADTFRTQIGHKSDTFRTGKFRVLSISYDEKIKKAGRKSDASRTHFGHYIKNKEIKNNIIINNNINSENDFSIFPTIEHELIEFVRDKCPAVAKMREQLDPDQAGKLSDEFGSDAVREILLQMENWTKINTKKSVYLTARNWLKKNQNDTKKPKLTYEDVFQNYFQ